MMKTFLSCRDEFLGLVLKIMLFLTLFFSQQSKAQCPTGDVVLHNEYDLEQFYINYPNCTNIPGVLQLGNLFDDYSQNTTVAGPIVNNSIFDFLSQIQSVGGLKIYNTLLTNVHYFENLTNINGVLEIRGNKYITGLYGLRNVNPAGITDLILQSNNSLYYCTNDMICAYMNGSGPRTVSGNQSPCDSNTNLATICLPPCVAPTGVTSSNITPNGAKISWTSSGSTFDLLWGVEGFTPVIGTDNEQFGVSGLEYQITGLSASTTYDVWIRQNCTGNQSDWVKHTFSTINCGSPNGVSSSNITQNNATINWTTTGTFDLEWGTAGFTQGTGTSQNEVTALNYQITGLNLGTTYDVYVRQNCITTHSIWIKHTFTTLGNCPNGLVTLSSMTDINNFVSAFPNCTQMSGGLWIQGSGITSLSALSNIQSVGGHLTIRDTRTDMSGLSSLTSINGDLVFWENPQLTNLTGLSSLTSINGKLQIFNNDQLTDISGVQNISTGMTELHIGYNDVLSNCNIASVCAFISTDGYKAIAGNATGCEDVDALAFNCLPPCEVPANITFTSISLTVATINWSNSGTFDLEWGTEGFAQGTGTSQNGVSGLNYQITELSENTSYDVYVRQNCTVNQSEWMKFTFSTILCVEPTSITSTNIVSDKATINWTNSGTFDLEWGIAGFTQGTGTTQNGVSGLNYQITGLSENTSYDVYVRQNCTISQSNWVKHTFSTISVCPSGDVILRSQQDINNFGLNYPNCTHITGYLLIENWYGNITNLTPLNNIQSIGGYLKIDDTYSNLNGLSSLTTVGGYIILSNNSFFNLNGLSSLTSVGGNSYANITIEGNYQLNDISGIQNINNLFYLKIKNNSNLSNCNIENVCNYLNSAGYFYADISGNATGCESKDAVKDSCPEVSYECPTGNVTLTTQSQVYEFSFNNCTTIQGDLTITSANDLTVLDSIETITGNLKLSYMASSIDGLASLTTVGGNVEFGYNSQLTTLNALSALTSVGGNFIIAGPPLSSISGLSSLETVGGEFKLNSTQLTNLSGFSSLTSIGGNLVMNFNSQLTNIGGATALTNIGGNIEIYGNNSLTNLDGLSAIEDFDGAIEIRNNTSLTDISGIENLINTNGFTLRDNTSLSDCSILCSYLESTGGIADIYGNGGPCFTPGAILYYCPGFVCTEAEGVEFLNITSDKASIKWSNLGYINIEWGAQGFTRGIGQGTLVNFIDPTTNPNGYQITGLSANTTYDIYVQRYCSSGYSEWVKYTFTTLTECPNATFYFTSQADIVNFRETYPNCTASSYQMNLHIEGSDITDLTPLSNLTTIGGHIIVRNNPLLTTLNGLNSITHNEFGSVQISNNPLLVNLEGLEGLTNVNYDVNISFNNQLASLSGLEGLTSVPNIISIYENPQLTSLEGLEGLTNVGGNINVFNNIQLSVCNIASICKLIQQGTTVYTSYNAPGCNTTDEIKEGCPCDDPSGVTFSNINPFDITLNVVNSQTVDIEWGVGGFTQGTGTTENSISGHNYQITGLTPITTYDVYIRSICTATQNSDWVKYSFSTIAPPCPLEDINLLSQTDVDDFVINHPNCVNMVGSLTISGSTITNISVLQNISSIAGGLQISNTSLVNLNGLSNLTSVGGGLTIQDNTILENISAIESIDLYGLNEDGLTITDNTNLATCNIGSICDYLSNSDTHNILNNKADCYNSFTILASCQPISYQSCEDSVYLYTQMEVDYFGANNSDCTHINGKLEINGGGIDNLSALSNIVSIASDLEIKYTTLSNLSGLNNLTSVGGGIYISDNNSLQNINALTSLNSINGLGITYNSSLVNIDILSSLTSIEGTIFIIENPSLTNINGLSGLTSIGDDLYIANIELLTNLDGLSNLTSIGGGLNIGSNTALENIDGLENLTNIGNGIFFSSNPLIENFNALSNVVNFEGEIYITENETLNDISGLVNIGHSSIIGIYIIDNPSLSVCNIENLCNAFADFNVYREVYGNAEGCESMNAVYAACEIEGPLCPLVPIDFYSQEDIDDFGVNYPNCTELPFSLYIYGEDMSDISDISAFGNLTSIDGSIYIIGTSLENLDDLSGLTSIYGEIIIVDNEILTSINGLQNIDGESIFNEWEDGIVIINNPQLSLCNLENFCGYLSDYDNPRQIYGNAEGCYETDFNNLCELFCPPSVDITFESQEEINYFGEMYPNCTEIQGNLDIWGWYNDIYDLSPLSNIQIIHGGFGISNTSITNLNAFINLTTVNGSWFYLADNELLEDISGLANLDLSNLNPIDMESDGLYIGGNPLLSVCNVPNICEYLSLDSATHPRIIEDNAPGCEDQDAVATACLEPFPCLAPIDIAVIATYNQATISWSSLGTSFDIEWGFVDFNSGEGLGSQNDISELNFTITDLEPETEYDVYIRRNCTDTEDNSDWVKYTFSTISICPIGDVYLYSQQEVDDFGAMYPECTEIQGNFEIGNAWAWESNDITDISALSNIETIGGYLNICLTLLTDLDGLSNLTNVNGSLVIYDNQQLTDISGIGNIQGINELYIGYNSLLSTCNVDSVCMFIQTQGISNIEYNAEGCENIQTVLLNCPLLECPIGDVELYSQEDVNNFGAMYPDCTAIEGYLIVDGYDSEITDLSPLSNIQSIGNLGISNTQVENLDAFSNLIQVGGISISGNQNLTNISGLQNVDSTNMTGLSIYNNPMLSVCNLPNFCSYLTYNSNDSYIDNNLDDCISMSAVLLACFNSDCDNVAVRVHNSYWIHNQPSANTKLILISDYYVYDTLYACEIDIMDGGRLIITPSGTVIVNGKIINNSTAENLVVEHGGDLIQLSEVENEGPIKVEQVKYMKRLDYTLWSSPVQDMKLKDFSEVSPSGGYGTLWNRVYTMGESAWEQVWATQDAYLADASSTFVDAKGYLYRSRNDANPTVEEEFRGVFVGVPQNGDISINTPYEYNAIGNPYPSAINASDVLANGATALYFWTNTNAPDENGNYILNNWASYSGVGGTAASNGSQTPNGVIEKTQGFVIGFNEANPTRMVNFNNEMRTSAQYGQFFRQMSNDRHRYWLNLSDSQVTYNQILVGYIDNATMGVDTGIDATMFAYEGNAIYSLIDTSDEDYVIQGRSLPFETSDVVRLGFRAINAGSFTISLDNFDGDFESENLIIYLKDNFNQTQHNLKNGAYTFLSEEGMFDNRFEVVYQTTLSTETPISTDANWIVYRQDKGFQVQTIGFEMKEVSVYDMLGRNVYTSQAEGTTHQIPNLGAEGVFIVKVTTSEDKVLNKKVR